MSDPRSRSTFGLWRYAFALARNAFVFRNSRGRLTWFALAAGLMTVVRGAGLFEVPGPRGTRQASAGVGVEDPTDIETKPVLGMLSGFDRAVHGWDLSFSVTTMGTDPRILVEGIDWYRRDPDARKGIGRSEDLEMLRKIAS